jgi:UDP-3-O-[3-hydroxymyristoyl] N-acetylglucosamine deacetylase
VLEDIIWTLGRPVAREGIGLHSGRPCRAVLEPAPPGIWFAVGGGPKCRLEPRRAGFLPGRTVWQADGGAVEQPEHVASALVGLGVWAVSLRVWGGELPGLDGCAAAWCAALREAGLVAAEAPPERVVRRPFTVTEAGGLLRIGPSERLRASVEVDFGPGLAASASWDGDSDDFAARIATSRTFVLRSQIEAARAEGRGAGANASNTAVLDDGASAEAVAEAARHKLLDLLGDLAVVGAPLRGDVCVTRGGHRLHVTALRSWAAFDPG